MEECNTETLIEYLILMLWNTWNIWYAAKVVESELELEIKLLRTRIDVKRRKHDNATTNDSLAEITGI